MEYVSNVKLVFADQHRCDTVSVCPWHFQPAGTIQSFYLKANGTAVIALNGE